MRSAVVVVAVAGCGFAPAAGTTDGGHGSDSGPMIDTTVGPPPEAGTCGWSFAPTNFDPCLLAPNPTPLDVTSNTTLDPGATSAIKTTIVQSDGTTIAVFHLSALDVSVGQTLTVAAAPGIAGVVFAVEGTASVGGTIVAIAGSNDATHCAMAKGTAGTDSTANSSGAGGGGGGAGADVGGDGTDGVGSSKGGGGPGGKKVTGATSLSPLRGGCPGGNGARVLNSAGSGTIGGRGGGAIEISARVSIVLSGEVDANGRGGPSPSVGGDGGAGGGAGGGILLESPIVTISGRVCGDGGSGGEGGSGNSGGNSGTTGACTGSTFATTPSSGGAGGDGGDGSYSGSTKGGNAGPAANSAAGGGGGGGGGGGVGWIRVHTLAPSISGVVTPTPLVN